MLSYKNGGTSCESDEWTVWNMRIGKNRRKESGLKHLSVLQLNFMCWREFSVAFGN